MLNKSWRSKKYELISIVKQVLNRTELLFFDNPEKI